MLTRRLNVPSLSWTYIILVSTLSCEHLFGCLLRTQWKPCTVTHSVHCTTHMPLYSKYPSFLQLSNTHVKWFNTSRSLLCGTKASSALCSINCYFSFALTHLTFYFSLQDLNLRSQVLHENESQTWFSPMSQRFKQVPRASTQFQVTIHKTHPHR